MAPDLGAGPLGGGCRRLGRTGRIPGRSHEALCWRFSANEQLAGWLRATPREASWQHVPLWSWLGPRRLGGGEQAVRRPRREAHGPLPSRLLPLRWHGARGPPTGAFTGGWGRASLPHSQAGGPWGPGVLGSTPGRDTGSGRGSQGLAWGRPAGGMALGSGLLRFRRVGGFWNQRF